MAARAQYSIADAYYNLENYPDAIAAYSDVVKNCCCFKNVTCSICYVISNTLWM